MKLPVSRFFACGLLFFAFVGFIRTAVATHGCCCRCGCPEYSKVCRLVCEEKKVTVNCWGRKDEDFCVPGCSQCVCEHCETVCDDCENPKAPCHTPKKFTWREWAPKGAPTMYTKTKLMKKTITKKIPTYKWVVEDLCAECEADSPKVTPPAGVEIAPKPVLKGADSSKEKEPKGSAKPTRQDTTEAKMVKERKSNDE